MNEFSTFLSSVATVIGYTANEMLCEFLSRAKDRIRVRLICCVVICVYFVGVLMNRKFSDESFGINSSSKNELTKIGVIALVERLN